MSTILVYGASGMGKSYAMRNLDPADTFIICSDRKDLPFKGSKKKYQWIRDESGATSFQQSNYFESKEPQTILKALKKIEAESPCSLVVLDTLTHVIVDYFMGRALEKGFDRFNEMAKHVYDVLDYMQRMTKDVIVIGHSDGNDGNSKVRTIGKMLDEKVDIPSLFSIVLMPEILRDDYSASYYLKTQSDGNNSAKSPVDMFPDYRIPSDYNYVMECIRAYENDEAIPEVPTE